eukprot:Phypoly_transcript_08360.p1 GENE.Phypoly_transcript_08360~~Phypoly_transcript_08360.p1  ORF type:complete len:402 (+),score=60.75 Phypoly_transcript_08360:84-1208(+)
MDLTSSFVAFAQAPMLVRREICRIATYLKLEEKSHLYQIGTTADTIYILLKGVVHERTSKESYGDYEGGIYALNSGAVIGEQMVLQNSIHNTTATVKQESDVLQLSAEDYMTIRKRHEIDIQEKLEVLGNIPVFKMFEPNELVPLCDALLSKRYIPNKVIMEQGAEPVGVYFIKSGKCKMIKEMEVKKPLPPKTKVLNPPSPPPAKKVTAKTPKAGAPARRKTRRRANRLELRFQHRAPHPHPPFFGFSARSEPRQTTPRHQISAYHFQIRLSAEIVRFSEILRFSETFRFSQVVPKTLYKKHHREKQIRASLPLSFFSSCASFSLHLCSLFLTLFLPLLHPRSYLFLSFFFLLLLPCPRNRTKAPGSGTPVTL